jgi:LytS/YehU family sensor histidine kinase
MSLEHSEEQEIPTEREVAFLERYFDLQRARFEDRLEVVINVDHDVREALAPTLILQPLAENAIRHGISARTGRTLVEVRGWRDNGTLRLQVKDDGPGLPPGWDPETDVGVGLSNTRERLRRLYGDSHSFEITGKPGAGVRVEIGLPYHEATA